MDSVECQAIRGDLLALFEERLGPGERDRVLAHLATCAPCATHRAQLQAAAELACQTLVELVTDYLEGTLPADEHARLSLHLELCTGCHDYVDQMRTTVRLLCRTGDDAVSVTTRRELLDQFRRWQQE